MLVWRILSGVGEALQLAAILTVAAGAFPRHRGLAIGAVNMAFATGSVVGPVVATALLEQHDTWRSPMVVFGVFGLLVTLAVMVLVSRRFTEATSDRSTGANRRRFRLRTELEPPRAGRHHHAVRTGRLRLHRPLRHLSARRAGIHLGPGRPRRRAVGAGRVRLASGRLAHRPAGPACLPRVDERGGRRRGGGAVPRPGRSPPGRPRSRSCSGSSPAEAPTSSSRACS